MDKPTVINGLLAKRAERSAEMAALVEAAKAENRSLSADESGRFDAAETEIREIDVRVKELDEQHRADEAAAAMAKRYAPSGFKVTSEPEIYRKGPGGRSYFRDLHNARNKGDREAIDRLARNDQGRMADPEYRALSTTNGGGGEFVPPLWLENEFVRLARAGRITADLIGSQPLPPGTDSISIPKVNTGTKTAVQSAQNSGVQNTDLTTTSVSSTVTTIAGGQTVSLQLIEQSPLQVDSIILADLAADYAATLDNLVLNGSGSAGQPTGVLTLAGTNSIAFTSGTPTVAQFYSGVANAIQQIHTKRFLPPDAIIMHPRRWAWLVAASDTQGRPLVVPHANSPMNAVGNQDGVVSQGYVGTMQGLPVYVDALLPTNLGAGTNQDTVIVGRLADLMLWEGSIRAEAFPQTYANQMSIFVRLYNYMSFQPARFPSSISVIGGTGLVAPVF